MARPSSGALARARHPVAQAAAEQEPRASRLRRCALLAEESLANIRALREALAPEESDARERHELAG